MEINKEKCIGCERCHPYCLVGAIKTIEWEGKSVCEIDQEECVECGTCHERSHVCPVDAIYMPQLVWPRSIREQFSNPFAVHPSTNSQGRGTDEMKTNDVTGRFPRGVAGIAIEMGRPAVGTSIKDIQTVAMAMAELGVEFEQENPVVGLMTDLKTGKFDDAILGEKVLSAIIEFKIQRNRLMEVLKKIKEVSSRIETVFSLGLISRVDPDGTIPVLPIAEQAGFCPKPNMKINVGLGRPLLKEV